MVMMRHETHAWIYILLDSDRHDNYAVSGRTGGSDSDYHHSASVRL